MVGNLQRRSSSMLVVVMIALLVQWSRSDQRTAKRLDRAADRDFGLPDGVATRRDLAGDHPAGRPIE